jgi:hypothetical protein
VQEAERGFFNRSIIDIDGWSSPSSSLRGYQRTSSTWSHLRGLRARFGIGRTDAREFDIDSPATGFRRAGASPSQRLNRSLSFSQLGSPS